MYCAVSSVALAQNNSLQHFVNQAREAQRVGDHKKFYEMILAAHTIHPYHQGILYQTGIAAALVNRPEEAIEYLSKAIQIKADYDLTIDELKHLEDRDDFKELKKLQTDLLVPIIQSDTAFVIKDRLLHLECIAAGESRNVFYLGSIHKRKIIRVDEKGAKDFTTTAQDGLTSVFGIKTDVTKNILWACASPMTEMENFDSLATSGVFKYELASGKLLSKYIPGEFKGYVFGDLALDPKGNVFVSDSKNNAVFMLNQATETLDVYFTSDEFRSLQGLAFTDDGKYLFIADYVRGIFRLHTGDKTLTQLSQSFGLSTKSIDGLTYYNNSLISIQNLIVPMRVTQYFLNDANDSLRDFRIIDRGHPVFNEPTTGCKVNSTFYYVANSQWSGYDKDRKIKPADQLQDIVILKADLRKLK